MGLSAVDGDITWYAAGMEVKLSGGNTTQRLQLAGGTVLVTDEIGRAETRLSWDPWGARSPRSPGGGSGVSPLGKVARKSDGTSLPL